MAQDPALAHTITRYIAAYTNALGGPDLDGAERQAPLLEEWLPVLHGRFFHLRGVASGHPRLGDTFLSTSALVYLAPDLSWARTMSRWYRLGSSGDMQVRDPDGRIHSDPTIVDADGGVSVPALRARELLHARLEELAGLAETNLQDSEAEQLWTLFQRYDQRGWE